uniref:GDNF family receptor alpha-2 n=1 Tax=Cyanistes caeruleus TaxID=156563 RepID=A0A8C0UC10_CYACU
EQRDRHSSSLQAGAFKVRPMIIYLCISIFISIIYIFSVAAGVWGEPFLPRELLVLKSDFSQFFPGVKPSKTSWIYPEIKGEEFYEASPYEPVTSRLSDIFRLASIFSGMDPATTSKSNHCLDAAKACNLNDNCKRLRSGYISTCSRELSATEPCSRRKCHKALRQFFDRVPGEFTFRLLFCSCKDPACAERRRQTIVPSCSYEDKDKPNCLDLRSACRMDHLCRSRLADFHTNCQATFQSLTSCPGDNFQACLGSYAGLIGFDITPNYVDASTTSITISPWCSCKGSGNMEEECEKFLRDFTENPCLRNAIQAFGNGTDVNVAPKNPNPAVTVLPKAEKSPALPDDINDSNTAYDTSVISTCTSLQEQGLKPNKSKEQSLCYSEVLRGSQGREFHPKANSLGTTSRLHRLEVFSNFGMLFPKISSLSLLPRPS